MAEKLIRLPQLQRFKQKADLKYQDKLTAGSNITINNNVISAQTTFGQQTIYNATIPVSGWSGTSNAVTVQGLSAGDDVEVVGINPTGLTTQQIQAAKEDLYLITYGTTSANTITFYALDGLPSVDIPVTIRKILDTNVTTREYSAGSNITISNGVISADLTSVYNNSHATGAGDNHILCPARDTTTVFTATRNCKLTISLQMNDTNSGNHSARIYLNGVEAYSFFTGATVKWQRIGQALLMVSAGDVVSVNNDYDIALDANIGIFY